MPRWKLVLPGDRSQSAVEPPEHDLLWEETHGVGEALCHCALHARAAAAGLVEAVDHGRFARSVGPLQEPLLRGRRYDGRLALAVALTAISHLVFFYLGGSLEPKETAAEITMHEMLARSATGLSVNCRVVLLLRHFRAALAVPRGSSTHL